VDETGNRLLPWFLWAQLVPGIMLGRWIGWAAFGTMAVLVAATALIGRRGTAATEWLGLTQPPPGWWSVTWALTLPTVVWPRWLALPFSLVLPDVAAPSYTGSGVGFALMAVLVVPLMEEMLYRGLLLTALRSHGRWPAITVSALLFGLGHGPTTAFSTFLVGWVLAWLAWEYRSIWPGVIIHTAFNLFAALGALAFESGPGSLAEPVAAVGMLLVTGAALVITGRRRATIRRVFGGPWLEPDQGVSTGREILRILGRWPVAAVGLISLAGILLDLSSS